MSDLRRQMFWHEDFTRNFSRFFSRSKSVDKNESDVSSTAADASLVSCSAHRDPEQHMDTVTSPQEPQSSDVLDRNSESHVKDSMQGGAEGSALEPPPLSAPAPQPGSTAPPVEGFFRRLSLFLFSQAEPSGVQRDRQTDTDSSHLISRDSQTRADTQKTAGGVELSQETLDLSECHSEVTHTQSEEQSEECSSAVDINSAKELLEEKRRYDLACPPVVTYGRYRGLKEVRRQKRKRHMELHSPVSEGDEATHPDEETGLSPTTGNPTSHTPSCIQPIESALTQSALHTETRDKSGQTPANRLLNINKTDSDQLVISIGDSIHRVHKAEQSPLKKPSNSEQKKPHSENLDTGSVDIQSKQLLFCTDAHCHTQLSDINIDRHSLFPATEQSSELEKLSVSADTEEHSAPDDPQSWNIEKRRSALKLSEGDSGKDEDVRLESVKMVDNILENAFAALQRMEVSDPESEDLLTSELTEGSERVLFEGADGGGNTEQQFSGTPSLVLEEGLTGGRSHADGCRSTPSSGYESIAGSDTDIRCCVGVASEITTTNGPISSQHEEHDTNQTVLEYIADERASCGRDVLLNCAADEESDNLHIIQRKDIRLAPPACSESRSRENHIINVSVNTMERDGQGNRFQDTSKDNTMSIDCKYNLNGDDCTVDTDTSVRQENQSQSLSEMAESEPFNHSLASDKTQSEMRDRAQMSEVVQQLPAAQSRETVAAHSYSAEQDRLICGSEAEMDVRFLLVDSFLPSETEVQSDEPVHSEGLDLSHWASVGAFSCNVTVDQSGSETLKEDLESELSVDRAESRTSAVCLSGKRIHLDSIAQHSRLYEPEQVDGGFASISEEEEMDSVFVNDTGPMYSPSTRKAKTYPFSLSPIFEESVCEEASGQEMMQVPPATEEEQKQPALSILTLLQSVSEKLQSSVTCDSDEGCIESLRAEPRPLWDRYREDSEDDDDNFSILLHQQLTEETPVHVPNTENEPSSDIEPMANEAKDRLQEEQECNGMLGTVGENANMPFCRYLTSSVMPSADKEAKDSSAVCHSENNVAITGQIEGFGKFNHRPSIMFIYEGQSLSTERQEVFDDVEDAEKFFSPHGSTVHAVRGCWLLYADSGFHGSCVLLEEGQTVRTSGEPQQNLEELREPNRTDHTEIQTVGSIRTLQDSDDSVPEIHLNMSQSRDMVCVFSATDVMEEFGPLFLSDVCVKTGCWLAYEKPGFSGNSAVLEMERRITPFLQNSLLSCVKSLRPLKMGGLKVLRPLNPKVILYEKVKFQGKYRELLDHAASLRATEGPVEVSSIRVMGGIWVCFSREGFRGHQRVLEEGQYSNCTQLFSGTECTIKSLRYIQTDFLEPSVCLRSSDEEINMLDLDVPDLQPKEVKSICVTRGAWVAYSERRFTGDQHVLEKGQYPGDLEWGGGRSQPGSLRPIRREVCGIVEPKFLICVYTQPHYGGECREFVGEAPDCRVPEFISFRVIRGSWLLFDEEGYSGNQYILGEGLYPDLTSCGCVSPKSLKPIPYSFTDPSVSLFSLSGFEGLEETLFSEMENMRQFFSQSVRVNGGLWVAFEFSHFKGRQMLLQPGEYPDWGEHSGWDTIGSLKSLKQPKVPIQVRNRALDSVLTTENVLEGSFPAKLFLSPADRSLNTQCWIYTDSLLKNTVQRGCVSVIGAKACVGARVALWEEHGRMNQRWSLNGDGTISSHLNHSLVLDLKGGSGTDRDHVILSQLSAHKATQTWDVDVL